MDYIKVDILKLSALDSMCYLMLLRLFNTENEV